MLETEKLSNSLSDQIVHKFESEVKIRIASEDLEATRDMATHSSVRAWRIPGTGEPGGLPSLGSHRVGHD